MSELLDDLFGEGFSAGRPRLVPGERWIADHPAGPWRREDAPGEPADYREVERVTSKDGRTTIVVGPQKPPRNGLAITEAKDSP